MLGILCGGFAFGQRLPAAVAQGCAGSGEGGLGSFGEGSESERWARRGPVSMLQASYKTSVTPENLNPVRQNPKSPTASAYVPRMACWHGWRRMSKVQRVCLK